MNTVNWPGLSGTSHSFQSYPVDSSWNSVGAVYIFAKIENNSWVPVYIGKTNDLANRHADHEREAAAKIMGAWHLHVKVVTTEAERSLIEQDLIAGWNPPLNVQHRTKPAPTILSGQW